MKPIGASSNSRGIGKLPCQTPGAYRVDHMVELEEVILATLLLASDDSFCITGAALPVHGGLNAMQAIMCTRLRKVCVDAAMEK